MSLTLEFFPGEAQGMLRHPLIYNTWIGVFLQLVEISAILGTAPKILLFSDWTQQFVLLLARNRCQRVSHSSVY
jgi:hypothetical protein